MADGKDPRAGTSLEHLTPVTFDDLVRMAGRIEFPVDREPHDIEKGDNRG